MKKPPFLRLALLAACFGCAPPSLSADKVDISIGQAEFEGLTIEGLNLGWTPGAGSAGAVTIRSARVRGVAATGPVSAFALDCPALTIDGDELSCERGRLSGSLGTLGVQNTRFKAKRLADGGLQLRFDSFAIAEGRGRLEVSLLGSRWTLDANLTGLDIDRLAKVAKPWLELPEDLTVAGKASGEFRATGSGDLLETAQAEVALESLDFADAAGTLAGERVAGTLEIDATAGNLGGLTTRGKIALTGGQAYSDPVFLDFGAHGARIEFSGELDTEAARLVATEFSLDHSGVLQASGSATLDFAGETILPDARVRIATLDVGTALPAYAQPFLIESGFKDIGGSGIIRGEIDIGGGVPTRAALDLDAVAIESATAAISLAGLRGKLNWFDDASRSALAGQVDDSLFQSRLAWDSGRLWGLELGAADLPFATTGRHFRLLESAVIPIFDGGLAIDTLRVRHAGTDEMYVRFDAVIRPISVALLSRAFGWPEFQGTLAGSIPGLQLRQGVVTLDGNLEATVFDGQVVVSNLSLSDPLGKFPAHARDHRHQRSRPRPRHADIFLRHDHRSAVGVDRGTRDLRLDAGSLRRLPLHADRRSLEASHQPARRHEPVEHRRRQRGQRRRRAAGRLPEVL